MNRSSRPLNHAMNHRLSSNWPTAPPGDAIRHKQMLLVCLLIIPACGKHAPALSCKLSITGWTLGIMCDLLLNESYVKYSRWAAVKRVRLVQNISFKHEYRLLSHLNILPVRFSRCGWGISIILVATNNLKSVWGNSFSFNLQLIGSFQLTRCELVAP